MRTLDPLDTERNRLPVTVHTGPSLTPTGENDENLETEIDFYNPNGWPPTFWARTDEDGGGECRTVDGVQCAPVGPTGSEVYWVYYLCTLSGPLWPVWPGLVLKGQLSVRVVVEIPRLKCSGRRRVLERWSWVSAVPFVESVRCTRRGPTVHPLSKRGKLNGRLTWCCDVRVPSRPVMDGLGLYGVSFLYGLGFQDEGTGRDSGFRTNPVFCRRERPIFVPSPRVCLGPRGPSLPRQSVPGRVCPLLCRPPFLCASGFGGLTRGT